MVRFKTDILSLIALNLPEDYETACRNKGVVFSQAVQILFKLIPRCKTLMFSNSNLPIVPKPASQSGDHLGNKVYQYSPH